MNKYTLQFKDHQLEQKYLAHKIGAIQFPILTFITGGGILLLVSTSIANLFNGDYVISLIKGGVLLYLVVQYFFQKKYEAFRKYCSQALMFTNFASVIFDIFIPSNYTQFDGYLLGSNQMLVHTILMFACNLGAGVMSNIMLTIVRILIAMQTQTSLTIQQYLYTIVMCFSLIVIQFQLEKQYRLSYLLSIKDNTWDVLIPLLLRKPFFIFSFNTHDNEYHTLLSNQEDYFNSDTPLSNFLFQSKIKRKSLWTYIDKKTRVRQSMNAPQCLFQQTVDVEYQQSKTKVTILACKFVRIVYAIMIDSEDPILKTQKQQFQETLLQYKCLMNRQLAQINKVLGTYLDENYHPLLRTLRISLIQVYHLQQNHSKLQLVKMKKLLCKCTKIFETPNIQIKVNCGENLKFVTLKSTLIIFLFEILKTLKPDQQLFIIVNQDSMTTIYMYGLNNLPISGLFEKTKEIIVENVVQKPQYFSFQLMKSPQTKFNLMTQENWQDTGK